MLKIRGFVGEWRSGCRSFLVCGMEKGGKIGDLRIWVECVGCWIRSAASGLSCKGKVGELWESGMNDPMIVA